MGINKYYCNPVLPGFYPDPAVVRVGEDYYMVNSTFQYFPGITISHSKDLIHWEIIGHGIIESDYLDLSNYPDGTGVWAPAISYHNGEFYIWLCLVNLSKDRSVNERGNYVIKSKKPEGPYSRPIKLTDEGNDPSHFVDDDGTNYLLYAGGIPRGKGTKCIQLNDECNATVGEPFWMEWNFEMRAPEGPHLFKKDGYYYLVIASSDTIYHKGHHGIVARARNIKGPYEASPYNPFLAQKDPEALIQHAGHGNIIQTQHGEWWMPYICRRDVEGYSILGRETALDRVDWTEDGWPVINHGNGPSAKNIIPNLEPVIYEKKALDDFDQDRLGLQWLFVRNPVPHKYSLTERKGHLRIYSADYPVDDIRAENIILQREESHHYEASTKLEFKPQCNGDQAGMLCYYDTSSYIKFAYGYNNGYHLIVEEKKSNKRQISTKIKLEESPIIFLKIQVNGLHRQFLYSLDGKVWETAGEVKEAGYLSDQGTSNWPFTGTMVGVFVSNNGCKSQSFADFDWFRKS